ncbi:MAG: hypothetical protein AAGC93_15990 [Cyanobacteria bacterium P01_F01_bin.53]
MPSYDELLELLGTPPDEAQIQANRERAIAHATRPWADRRGIESIDHNYRSLLVKASMDELAEALEAVAIETKQDVLGTEVEALGCFALVYQILGQAWSIFLSGELSPDGQTTNCSRPDAAKLSQLIQQPVIAFNVSDTSSYIGYRLFEDGIVVESFSGTEGGFSPETVRKAQSDTKQQYYELRPYQEEDPEASPQEAFFWSRDRQLTASEIGNIWHFPDQFLCEQSAYEPVLDIHYFIDQQSSYRGLQRGQRYSIQNPGTGFILGFNADGPEKIISIPELVRVDYFRFGN